MDTPKGWRGHFRLRNRDSFIGQFIFIVSLLSVSLHVEHASVRGAHVPSCLTRKLAHKSSSENVFRARPDKRARASRLESTSLHGLTTMRSLYDLRATTL